MKVYIIMVTPEASFGKVSQEGYSSLEAAQAWIMGRADKPRAIRPHVYRTEDYTRYEIFEVTIK